MLIFALLACAATLPGDALANGTQLTYRGQFVAAKGEVAESEKHFELIVLLTKSDAGRVTALWTTEELGRGGWSWLGRFGKLELDDQLRPVDGLAPTLLVERPEGKSIVPLLVPLITYAEPFAKNVRWVEGNLEHRVVDTERVRDVDAWQIEVRGPTGRKRHVAVEQASPIVVALSETVFIGQGEQHDLRFELIGRQALNAERLSGTMTAFEEFLRLRTRLEIDAQQPEISWSAERLALLKADLPVVVEKSRGSALEKLARSAGEQAKLQREQAGAIGALQGKLVGTAAPRPKLETMTGDSFDWPTKPDAVVVLHFWDYRDAPLEEPYGQVAYLDFLSRQHGKKLQVYGVVTNERVTQAETKRAGVQSAKRMAAFMNLSYPLLVDSGEAIKAFGDPRVTGAKLPLFVVIDRTGKIAHYHVGHYEVNRERGLEELDRIVRAASATP